LEEEGKGKEEVAEVTKKEGEVKEKEKKKVE